MATPTTLTEQAVILQEAVHLPDAAEVGAFVEQSKVHLRWCLVVEPRGAQFLQDPFFLSRAQRRWVRRSRS